MFQQTGKKKTSVSVQIYVAFQLAPLSPARRFRHCGNTGRGPSYGSAEGAAGAPSRRLQVTALDGRAMAAVSTNTVYSAVVTDTAPDPHGQSETGGPTGNSKSVFVTTTFNGGLVGAHQRGLYQAILAECTGISVYFSSSRLCNTKSQGNTINTSVFTGKLVTCSIFSYLLYKNKTGSTHKYVIDLR